MKYWIPENWSDTFDHEGLLFFVQRVQEMLFHFSDDVYRAPVHNTSTLIQEYINVHIEVKTGAVGGYQLVPIYEEVKDSFLRDKILYTYLGEQYVKSLYDQLQSCTETNRINLVNYLSGLIKPFYLGWATDYLKSHIADGKHKNEIEAGTRAWISDLIMRGYTSEFIYSHTEHFLVQGNIESIEMAKTYFDRFDFNKRAYKVYFQLSDYMSQYFEILKARISLSFDDDGNYSLIQPKRDRTICHLEIESLDYYKAIAHAYESINIFIKYYQFISNKRTPLLHKFGAVWDSENNQMHHMPIIPTGLKAIETHSSMMSAELIDNTILGMQTNAGSGMSQFNKAIALHNSAIQQQHPKDGFINLWSILEVFCPQGESPTKIDPILHAVLPVLQNDYFTTVFSRIDSDLEDNLSESDYAELMLKINNTGSLSAIAGLCLLPEYEQLRDEIFIKELKDYPLLRNKIYSLYILKEDKNAFFALSRRYRQRVKWHLYRLYRARNAIVHTGSIPHRIQVLGEHLHSYVDCVMFEVAFKLGKSNVLQSIGTMFVDTELLLDSKDIHFSKNTAIDAHDLDILFQNTFYPKLPQS